MEIILIGIFIFTYKFLQTKNNVFYKSLFLLYLITFVFACILSFIYNYIASIQSFLFLIIVLILWFSPFKNLSNDLFAKLNYDKGKLFLFTKILNIILVPASFYFAYYSIIMFSTQDISNVRLQGTDSGALSTLPRNIISTIFSSVSTLYFIPLFLFFLYLKEGYKKNDIVFLFISSLSFIFLTLCYAGRDGIVYWLINFFIIFFLFRKQFSKKINKTLTLIIIIALLFFISIFAYISFFRFSNNSGSVYDSVISIINYLGQQPHNFSNIFNKINILKSTNTSLFPGFRSLFGLDINIDSYYIYDMNNLLSEYNVFGYFVKSLYLGYGIFFSVFISIVFLFVVRSIINLFIKNRDIFTFFIIFVLFQIPMNGVFYYRQGIGMGDVIFTLFILLCIMFKKISYGK
jgi:oligosaccharide repeat unit polymerase